GLASNRANRATLYISVLLEWTDGWDWLLNRICRGIQVALNRETSRGSREGASVNNSGPSRFCAFRFSLAAWILVAARVRGARRRHDLFLERRRRSAIRPMPRPPRGLTDATPQATGRRGSSSTGHGRENGNSPARPGRRRLPRSSFRRSRRGSWRPR